MSEQSASSATTKATEKAPNKGTDKTKRHRSPNYPAVGLRNAVERVRALWAKDGKAGAPPNIAAIHIGFQTAHGEAMSVLAALKKYGLVEQQGDRLVPTQRAIEIVNLPESDARRLQALRDAALGPSIYRELAEQHADTGFPADDVLQSELITYKGFNPHSVEGFVKDFRDTLEFAGLTEKTELKSETMRDTQQQDDKPIGFQSLAEVPGRGNPSLTFRRYPMDISIPRSVKAELAIGGELRKEDLERLKKQIDRILDNLSDAFED